MSQCIFALKRFQVSLMHSQLWHFFSILLIRCMFQDMVAFSCCTYDGGWREKTEMDNARERSWRGKFRRHGRVINPEANRRDGKCPLTPLEVSTSYFLFVFVFVYYKHILSLGLLGCTAIVHQLMGVLAFFMLDRQLLRMHWIMQLVFQSYSFKIVIALVTAFPPAFLYSVNKSV
jgi:hypothetical protein